MHCNNAGVAVQLSAKAILTTKMWCARVTAPADGVVNIISVALVSQQLLQKKVSVFYPFQQRVILISRRVINESKY